MEALSNVDSRLKAPNRPEMRVRLSVSISRPMPRSNTPLTMEMARMWRLSLRSQPVAASKSRPVSRKGKPKPSE